MGVHTVAQGECLASIAHRYGFAWQTIYHAPENAALRAMRPNPNVLYPGDAVAIPERVAVGGRVMTGRQHEFRVHRAQWVLRLRLRDHDHEPLGGVPWTLTVAGTAEPIEGTTEADGLIEVPISEHARRATLEVLGQTHTLEVGALDPVSRVTGVQQRLARLGYDPGSVDGMAGPRTHAALRAFQSSQDDLTPTGRLDDATRLRLQVLCDELGHETDLEDAVADDADADPGEPGDGSDGVDDADHPSMDEV